MAWYYPIEYSSTTICEQLKTIKTNSSFHFKLADSVFVNSTYLNSNQLNATVYIDILNAKIYSLDTDYSKLASIYNTDLSYNLVPTSPYFFNILGFTNINVQNISVNDTVFKQSLFRINDTL